MKTDAITVHKCEYFGGSLSEGTKRTTDRFIVPSELINKLGPEINRFVKAVR